MEIEVGHEPLTYDRHSEASYFQDLWSASQGDNSARNRIERHEREMTVELERRDDAARRAMPGGYEYRVNPNSTDGTGGYLAPPLWVIDKFATAPRAPRQLANLIPNFPLPRGVQSINLPRLTTGTQETGQADGEAVAEQDVVDAAVTANVITIAGEGDVSVQLLEQSPSGAHLDFVFFKDLLESYDAQLEAQLLNGSTSNQITGILNVSGIGSVTYTDSTPTPSEMYASLGQVVASVGNNRKLPPECWLMTTSRLAWLGSGEDNNLRPLMLDNRDGSGEMDLLSYPVKQTDAMPTTLSGNQDRIIACRPSDLLLFESATRTAVQMEPLSGTLRVRLSLHRSAAALTGRYPSSIAVLTGSGTVVQTNF